jgi:hypothetical protein
MTVGSWMGVLPPYMFISIRKIIAFSDVANGQVDRLADTDAARCPAHSIRNVVNGESR